MALYVEDHSSEVRPPATVSVLLSAAPTSAQSLTDVMLIKSIAEGDEMALASLYDRYAQAIYNAAVHRVQQAGVAEEIVQETFFRVWRAASIYAGGPDKFQAWLLCITCHLCLDHLGRQQKSTED